LTGGDSSRKEGVSVIFLQILLTGSRSRKMGNIFNIGIISRDDLNNLFDIIPITCRYFVRNFSLKLFCGIEKSAFFLKMLAFSAAAW